MDIEPDSPPIPSGEIRRFVRETFGLRGTLRLHRAALGGDLIRAPLNVILAPVFLIVRLTAGLARLLRLRGVANWLSARHILLSTRVSALVAKDVTRFFATLDGHGIGPGGSAEETRAAVDAYVSTRSAVAEMVTLVVVIMSGFLLFHTATPGLVSLAGPFADLGAQTLAIDRFPLGPGLGRVWYGLFPAALPVWMIALVFMALSVISAFVTTFAGLVADPVQVATGTHRRRLERLFRRIADRAGPEGLAREHVAARMGDIGDLAFNLIRFLRG
ncbi:MAG: DUF6635 family protein [Pseudomonadota bacterium]|nr:DUF6635 family protein [Pseudomonadota bacterium]